MAKLVDILARELKEWPGNNLDGTEALFMAQDSDGMMVTLDPEETASVSQFEGEDWSRSHWTGGDPVFEVAEDYRTAIVTRAQWRDAVDALKAGSQSLHVQQVGRAYRLPPDGSTVRIDKMGRTIWDSAEMFIGVDVTLVARFMTGDTLMVAVEHPVEMECCCFRADMVRTPEQVEAEIRENTVQQMLSSVNFTGQSNREIFRQLYDLGYRKFEIHDES